MITALLLFLSNIFMTLAWYGYFEVQGPTVVAGNYRKLGDRIF
jgi:uncharacterized protein (DUF486 family)